MSEAEQIWITAGYQLFALSGDASLKVEVIARKAGISKSSFYHHFAEVDIFVDRLLTYHLEQSAVLAVKEAAATSIDPELIDILIEHRMDILFNRQLRFNQHNERYKRTRVASDQLVGNAFVKLWATELNLKLTIKQLEGLFELALENFYLQVNPDNLDAAWLRNYFANLKRIALNFSLDGTV